MMYIRTTRPLYKCLVSFSVHYNELIVLIMFLLFHFSPKHATLIMTHRPWIIAALAKHCVKSVQPGQQFKLTRLAPPPPSSEPLHTLGAAGEIS